MPRWREAHQRHLVRLPRGLDGAKEPGRARRPPPRPPPRRGRPRRRPAATGGRSPGRRGRCRITVRSLARDVTARGPPGRDASARTWRSTVLTVTAPGKSAVAVSWSPRRPAIECPDPRGGDWVAGVPGEDDVLPQPDAAPDDGLPAVDDEHVDALPVRRERHGAKWPGIERADAGEVTSEIPPACRPSTRRSRPVVTGGARRHQATLVISPDASQTSSFGVGIKN